ncbi:hypothetical protein ACHAWF_014752, partial [Thalassiosira exigua]
IGSHIEPGLWGAGKEVPVRPPSPRGAGARDSAAATAAARRRAGTKAMAPSASVRRAHLALSAAALLASWNGDASVSAFRPPGFPTGRRHAMKVRRDGLVGSDGRTPAAARLGATEDDDGASPVAEAERLLAKARAIRDGLDDATTAKAGDAAAKSTISEGSGRPLSEFSLEEGHRLYLDVGREPGTWMDPRWGASGRRIEGTVDVSFGSPTSSSSLSSWASDGIAAGLRKTITQKSSKVSPVHRLKTAPYARLRGGFDKMKIAEGGYCVESPAGGRSSSASSTLRFCLSVEGTKEGDATIPEGLIYFALPCFRPRGGSEGYDDDSGSASRMTLSKREGTITIKQMGWHTGWYREESRILGVFRAVPLEEARVRDKF